MRRCVVTGEPLDEVATPRLTRVVVGESSHGNGAYGYLPSRYVPRSMEMLA